MNLTLSQNSLQIASESLKLLRLRNVFQFLKHSKVTFRNLVMFWAYLSLNNVIRRFCKVTILN